MTKETKPATTTPDEKDRVDNLVRWAKSHERSLTVAAAVVAVIGGGVWFAISAKQRKEAFAQRELAQAQSAVQAANLPLAANDLSRITQQYGSTLAGQEAQLLLGQVRLQQGQASLAATQLQEFIASGPKEQYISQAYDLLGAALEQTGRFRAAGDAYEKGAGDSPYQYYSARLLMSAARSYTAGADTTSAVRVLERVVNNFSDSPEVREAKLRLAELGHYVS